MNDLEKFREVIDAVDDEIVSLIARRLNICRDVAAYKKRTGVSMMQPGRVDQVKERCAERGSNQGLRPEFVKALYAVIIQEACVLEDEIIENRIEP